MKILLVQTSFLGDTILSTPVISTIDKRFPEAELWMLVTPESVPLVEHNPYLKGVLQYDKRGADRGLRGILSLASRIKNLGFDRCYALHRSYRTAMLLFLSRIPERIAFKGASLAFLYHDLKPRSADLHDVERNLQILGESCSDEAEMLLVAPEDPRETNPYLAEVLSGIERYIVLAPGSVWNTKRWHWQGYVEVAKHFSLLGFKVLLCGAQGDRELCARIAAQVDVINLAGEISLKEYMYVVKHARLLVCNDSMSLHMASAFKVPNVAIFCATSPRFGFGPWRNMARVVEKEDLPCKPCRRHGSNRCPTGTESCMRDLPASNVIEAAEELVEDKRRAVLNN